MYGPLSMYDLEFEFAQEDMEYLQLNVKVLNDLASMIWEALENEWIFGKLMFGEGRSNAVKLCLK